MPSSSEESESWGDNNNEDGDEGAGADGGGARAQPTEAETYHGQFWMGKRHGVGRLEKANGEIYLGEWENDRQRGKGILIGRSNE